MPILFPSLLDIEGYSFDGSCVKIGTGLVDLPNAIAKLSYGDGLEGIAYTRALGKVSPVAMTFGEYTPEDITMEVHAAYGDALRGVFAPFGNVYDIVSSLQAQYKAKLSIASPAGSLLTLPTRTDTLDGFRIIKMSDPTETGGAALMEQWTCKCLKVRRSGNAATTR